MPFDSQVLWIHKYKFSLPLSRDVNLLHNVLLYLKWRDMFVYLIITINLFFREADWDRKKRILIQTPNHVFIVENYIYTKG